MHRFLSRFPFSARGYALLAAGVTFLALLFSAGTRAAPAVMMQPIEMHMGWDRPITSAAAGIGILLYGMVGPFAATLMLTLGIRRTMLGGLALMSIASLASLWMTSPWHYLISWGVVSGIGTGGVAVVLGAAVVNRWFAKHQGLAMGVLTASTATGALIFLPFLAWLSEGGAWRPVALATGIACAVMIPIVYLFMAEGPAALGLRRWGEAVDQPDPAPRSAPGMMLAFTVLRDAFRRPIFWLLAGSFFVCGLTTNGLIGTHLIAYCGDLGIGPLQAAGLLSLMGVFDLIGTTVSGRLTDKYDPKKLLVIYYGVRGLSLLALPFLELNATSMLLFAIFYGLDWIATVPPTVRLANQHFGQERGPIIFGWTLLAHQIGAATAAIGAGLIRADFGTYTPAFLIGGAFAIVAAAAILLSRTEGRGLATV